MRPVARNAIVVSVVLVGVLGGFTGGWYLRGSAGGSAPSDSATLSVVAAGSLAPILPSVLSRFANETPGVQAPVSAQLYEGSRAAASALTLPGAPYDLFVAADFRTIPQLLEPPTSSVASWELVFASDPLVLAYDPNVAALSGINASNWVDTLVAGGVTLGAPNASADPLGANVAFALELAGNASGKGPALYDHFFSGGEGGIATPTAATRTIAENVAATALETGEVSAYFLYRSYATVEHLAYVPLNASVDLGGTTSADVAAYAQASTTVLSGSSTVVQRGAPVLFALTVPGTAPDPALGIACAAFLVSNATASVWAGDGFAPLAPIWTDTPASLPAALSGTGPAGVAPLPGYLASLLG